MMRWSDERTLRRTGLILALAAAIAGPVAGACTAEPDGTRTPAAGAVVVGDPFTTTAADVAQWRAAQARVVCRLQVRVWQPDLPDAGRFPAAVLGEPVAAGSADRWLDVRQWTPLRPVLADRMRLCREKGFHAMTLADPYPGNPQPGSPYPGNPHPDGQDDPDDPGGQGASALATGFHLTRHDQLVFDLRLVRLAGESGLALTTVDGTAGGPVTTGPGGTGS